MAKTNRFKANHIGDAGIPKNFIPLSDDYVVRGVNDPEAKHLAKTLKEHTQTVQHIFASTGDIDFISATVDEEAKTTTQILFHAGHTLLNERLSKNVNALSDTDEGAFYRHSAKNQSLMFTKNNDDGSKETWYVSPDISLSAIGITGDKISKPSLERDIFIAHVFGEDKPVTFMVKEINGVKKVFSIASGKYTPISQTIILDVIKLLRKKSRLGTPICHSWSITNFMTTVFVEFPEHADELSKTYKMPTKLIPGIMITTSDTGDSSFRVAGTWRAEGSNAIVVNAGASKKHVGDLNIDNFMSTVENTIFAEYEKVPSALCELMCQDITDPTWDLTKTEDIAANRKRIEETLKVMMKNLKMVKAIGKKMEMKLRESLMAEMTPKARYTAYDFAMVVMSLPERADFSENKKSNMMALQKACAAAPFIAYKDDATVTIAME